MPFRSSHVTALHLVLLTALTLLKSALWVGLSPVLEIADEPAHFDNIQYRAERGQAPTYNDNGRPLAKVLQEGASKELWKLWTTTVPKGYYKRPHVNDSVGDKLRELARDPANRITDGQDPAMVYPGGYYEFALPFYKAFRTSSVITRIFAVRCASALLGLCAVIATYFAARLVAREPLIAFVAAVVVAFQPMASQMTAAVNNDAGMIGFGALLFYFQVRALAKLPAFPDAFTIAGLLGSAYLLVNTKPNGYGLLPGLAIVALAVLYVHRNDRRVRIAAGLGLLAALGMAVHLRHRGFDIHSVIPGNTDDPSPRGYADFWSFLDSLDQSYQDYLMRSAWGQFGWLDFSMQGDWVARLRLAFEVVFVGTVAATARYVLRDPDRPFWFRGRLWGFCILSTLIGIWFILFVEHRFRLTGIVGVIQGRNFLFALPAFAIWITIAFAGTVPRRLQTLSLAAVFSGALMLNVMGMITLMSHHYVP